MDGAVVEGDRAIVGRGKLTGVPPGAVIGAAPQVDRAVLEEKARLQREHQMKEKSPPEKPKTVIGGVQGVVHRGKWAQRRAAQQAQQQQQQQ